MLVGFPLYQGYFIFCTVLLLIRRLDIRHNPKRQGDKGNGKDENQNLKFMHLSGFYPLKNFMQIKSDEIKARHSLKEKRKHWKNIQAAGRLLKTKGGRLESAGIHVNPFEGLASHFLLLLSTIWQNYIFSLEAQDLSQSSFTALSMYL